MGFNVYEIGFKCFSWNDWNVIVVIILEGFVIYSLVNWIVDLLDKNFGNIKYFVVSCIVFDELVC